MMIGAMDDNFMNRSERIFVGNHPYLPVRSSGRSPNTEYFLLIPLPPQTKWTDGFCSMGNIGPFCSFGRGNNPFAGNTIMDKLKFCHLTPLKIIQAINASVGLSVKIAVTINSNENSCV